MKLRTVLRIEHKIQFTCGESPFTKRLAEEWEDKIRESYSCLKTILNKILIAIPTKSLNSLKCTTRLKIQKFRTTEKISVLI